MNRELFTARPEETADNLIDYFSALGIGASPVLARDGSLIGMISLRDLVRAEPDALVEERMRTPVTFVSAESTIEETARILGETGYHRLPVVDHEYRVVGIVSSLDVIRGLTGIPVRHPETFPHFDQVTGLIWTDDVPLEMDRVEAAPQGPGLIALVHGGAGVRERMVWAERAANVRARLIDMMSLPQENYPALSYWLDKENLRFRAASLDDEERGRRVVDKLQRGVGYAYH